MHLLGVIFKREALVEMNLEGCIHLFRELRYCDLGKVG